MDQGDKVNKFHGGSLKETIRMADFFSNTSFV